MSRQPRPARASTAGWVLFRLGGVPVVLAPSWLLIAAVLLALYYPVVRGLVPRAPTGTVAATTAAFVVMLFVSVLVHELAHGLVAARLGSRPREYVITFWGGHTAFERELPTPGASAAVSAAGPAANAVLAAAAWAATQLPGPALPLWLVLWGAVVSNTIVAVFNLLPGLPLDGGRILEAAVWRATGDRLRGTTVAAWGGRVVVVAVVAAVLLWPLLEGRRPGLGTVLWVAILGSFLWAGAGQSLAAARTLRAARTLDLLALLRPAAALPATASVADAEPALARGAAVVVIDGGRPVAVVDVTAVVAVPAERRATTPVAAVAHPLAAEQVLPPLTGAAAAQAVARAQEHGSVAVVGDAAGVRGIVSVADVAAALRRPAVHRRG
ncbi:site-2 protease family protein [Georgenia sp. TF02-10]|uniref:site-2 protease family protein n=1 Tax=Georgenia sp. TF02-10 TaxID=2917725 RepID=UPI001FA812BD|nr:site-2 protease family protein [Georgenia sp. TF02-10]UNX56133.1 site-2 protease family protein [Georgenia sp. TF02-10]